MGQIMVPSDATGWISNGQYFDGNDYVTAPDHCLGASNSWTASTWFKSDVTSGQACHYFFSTGMTDSVCT